MPVKIAHSNTRRFSAMAVFAWAISVLAPGAEAATSCVSTSQELRQALSDASTGGVNAGEGNEIDVVQGNYVTDPDTGGFSYSNSGGGHLMLYGGYNAGCSIVSHNAALTVLDGNHLTPVLSLHGGGEIDVVGFTIQNGSSVAGGAGVAINDLAGDVGASDLVGNIIRNNSTTYLGGGFAIGNSTGNIFIKNNLVYGNSADDGDGAGIVLVYGATADVYNNTVTQNTTSLAGGTGGVGFAGNSGTITLLNNILHGNTNYGADFGTSDDIDFEYNDYGTITGTPPTTMDGNLTSAPQFVDAASGDFHLATGSLLIGATPLLFNETDPDGHAMPAHGSSDIGAYFETIFTDGFQN